MNNPQRGALTAAIGAVAIPIAMGLAELSTRFAWGLLVHFIMVFPQSLVEPLLFIMPVLAFAAVAALAGFAIAKIWTKRP